MTDLPPLTPEQQALLKQYHLARIAWESSAPDNGTAWASALKACAEAGFDPFHYPAPR